jgi:hypothetical protein
VDNTQPGNMVVSRNTAWNNIGGSGFDFQDSTPAITGNVRPPFLYPLHLSLTLSYTDCRAKQGQFAAQRRLGEWQLVAVGHMEQLVVCERQLVGCYWRAQLDWICAKVQLFDPDFGCCNWRELRLGWGWCRIIIIAGLSPINLDVCASEVTLLLNSFVLFIHFTYKHIFCLKIKQLLTHQPLDSALSKIIIDHRKVPGLELQRPPLRAILWPLWHYNRTISQFESRLGLRHTFGAFRTWVEVINKIKPVLISIHNKQG